MRIEAGMPLQPKNTTPYRDMHITEPITAEDTRKIRQVKDGNIQSELADLENVFLAYRAEINDIQNTPFGAKEILIDSLRERIQAKLDSLGHIITKMPVHNEKHIKYSNFLQTRLEELNRTQSN